nr:hypothetical protein GCM10020185_50390 [Pseudomonas brassicacearum subsp. brassicacearum]
MAVEHLQKLMEESNLSVGGHVLFAHYQQGMTDYLAIALLHHSEGVAVTDELDVTPSRHLDLGQLHLAARINVSEWQNNKQSKQYISFIKGKNGKKVSEYFRDFIGCQEGVDGPGETRTLLKAFSDFVESEDLPEEDAREKNQDPGRLRQQPGQARRADGPGRTVRTDRRRSPESLLRPYPQQGLRVVAGNPGG